MRPGLALAVVLAVAASHAAAEDTTTAPAPSTTTSTALARPTGGQEEQLDLSFTSPQSTVRGFLVASRAGDYDKAEQYLDLRRLPKSVRATMGPQLARMLRTILDRTLWVDPDALSDAPEGERDDGLPAKHELVGTIRTTRGPVDVLLEHVQDPDGTLAWRFASAFVAQIPDLYQEFGNGPFADLLPDFMVEMEVATVRLWQWIALLVVLGAGALLAWVASGPLLRLLAFVVPADRRHQSARLLGAVRGPLRLLIVIVVLTASVPWLALSVPAERWLTLGRKTATTVVLTWLWLRIVDVVVAIADDRLRIHGRAGAVSVIPLLRRTIKIFVAIVAGIVVVQNLGYDATGILAGLGVGGLALALAAQKTIENLFGGVVIITDQPVRVGDLCRFGTRTGVVEDIGLRSTRIRTLERSLVTVPNAEFASGQIENLSSRDRMLLDTTIGLRLDTTAAQLRAVLDGLRTLVSGTPRVDGRSTIVRFVGITATAFEVQVQAYLLTRDWAEFLAIREDVYLQILDAVAHAGTGLTGGPMPHSSSA